MTREEFKKIVEVHANGYTFTTDKYFGFFATNPDDCYICLNDSETLEGVGAAVFNSIDEAIDTFEVNGVKFTELLPQITHLQVVYS